VLAREYCEERFGEEWEGIELVAADGKSEDSDIHTARAEAIEQDGCDLLGDMDLGLREFAGELRQDPGEKIGSDCGDGANGKRAGDGILALDDIAARCFKFTQDGTSARKKGFAEVGEADAAAETIEEAGAEFVLELEDLLGKRRLGDMGLLGGARKRAGIGNSTEVAELMEFHRLCLFILSELDIGTIVGAAAKM
jgi:hypothetical protein